MHRAACLTLMKLHARDSPLTLRDAEWQALCDRLHGYSGSDIATVILGALFEPIRDLQKATHWAYTSGQFFMPPTKVCKTQETFNFLSIRVYVARFCCHTLLLDGWLEACEPDRPNAVEANMSDLPPDRVNKT